MRKLGILVATGLIVAVAAGGMLTAGAENGVKVVRVVERATTDELIDVGEQGFSVGDLLTFANPLYDERNEKRVGHDQGSCIVVDVQPVKFQCSWTAWFEGGSVVVEGPFFEDRETTLAITGGTGSYSTADGTMRLGFRDDPAEFDFVYRIHL